MISTAHTIKKPTSSPQRREVCGLSSTSTGVCVLSWLLPYLLPVGKACACVGAAVVGMAPGDLSASTAIVSLNTSSRRDCCVWMTRSSIEASACWLFSRADSMALTGVSVGARTSGTVSNELGAILSRGNLVGEVVRWEKKAWVGFGWGSKRRCLLLWS
ncbi:hypothetical protein B0T22DRAFT_301897 [Podospora appendiculata]|uniref:Uncharacterized protein n=1 Tax=Podospora appendiculata TaxID=314037 RepID=A0AAE0X084_9PEZI|nr:hypothetical protein B0T22DRAFT_301897 [Podospora appendiculata]